NYEDIVKGLPQSDINKLVGKIDQTVSNWVSENNGVMHKTEKDRYYVLFENKDVINIIKDKFTILDKIKTVGENIEVTPTFSIGIGDGFTIQKCEEYAKIALDMSLGRGGDQAVIKNDSSFKFFGGKTEGTERNTRVKSRVVAHALKELIDNSSAVFVMGHKNADADSFGAAVAVCKMADLFDKKCYVVMGEYQTTTKKLVEEMLTEDIFKDAIISENDALQMNLANALLVIVDTHNPTYVDAPKLLDAIENKVLIDHHRRGPNFIDKPALTYHEPYASSTCEMITEVFQYIKDGAKFTVKEAQAVYSGIVLDTKNFNMKTGVRTFEAASFLRRMGVDTVNVKKIFQNDMSDYLERAKIVSNAQKYKDRIAISSCEDDVEGMNIIASQAADDLLNISDIKAAFVVCRNGSDIVISGRSLGDYNVQVVLEKIGGGGHMTIAGAQFKNLSMQDVLAKLRNAIDESE
ncbi:MAG: DHH family phosphoesterase, partial [Clostridia bacterium]|nr:DHH family phosphoesterase [Clostridia bacterium]